MWSLDQAIIIGTDGLIGMIISHDKKYIGFGRRRV